MPKTKRDDFLTNQEQQILQDWRRFIRSGFRLTTFTPLLAQHLASSCDFSQPFCSTPDVFWQAVFGQDTFLIWRFLNQFGGNHHSIFAQDRRWLDEGPAADLNRKMCAELRGFYRLLLATVSRYESLAHQKYGDLFYHGIPVRDELHAMMVEAVQNARRAPIRQPALFERRKTAAPATGWPVRSTTGPPNLKSGDSLRSRQQDQNPLAKRSSMNDTTPRSS